MDSTWMDLPDGASDADGEPVASGTTGMSTAGEDPGTGTGTTHGGMLPGALTQLSLGAVAVALVLLLVLPILVRQRSDEVRRQATEVAEPARDLSQDIERDVAVQVAAARGFALTGNPDLLQRYSSAGDDATRAFRRLETPATELGPRTAAAVEELRTAMRRWERQTVLGAATTPAAVAATSRAGPQELLFEATIAAAARLDAAIGQAVQVRRDEARRIDVVASAITGVLIALVLLSVILLARLGQQLRRLAEEARERALDEARLRQELEAAMESRARLIRGFSHDVRNPLGAADGYAQLLEGGVYGPLAERQLESVGRIRHSIGAAVVLTDDLLDLARLEAGQLQLETQDVEVGALAAETTEEYRAQAEAADLQIVVQLPPQPLHAHSDPRRIHQVLGNLISNAIKYTPDGGRVSIGVTARSGGAAPRAGDWIAVDVSDTGIGIQPAQRSRIFDEFARAEPEAARGAGLGLAISRRLARALGGDITLVSEAGAGSTFTFWLPAAPHS